MREELIFFTAFIFLIVGMLLLDLLVIGKKRHMVSVKEAAIWSGIWIFFALGFSMVLFFFAEHIHGIKNFDDLKIITEKYAPNLILDEDNFEYSLEVYRNNSAVVFLTGYLVEKSLSVDNLFVMMAILTTFSVNKAAYKPVLFWGIIGAIIMRFIFIFAGAVLLNKFQWLFYVFGIYLIYVGIKMYIQRNKETKIEAQNHPIVKFLASKFRLFPRYINNYFFIKKAGLAYITPLFIVLIIIEFTDVIFAFDSIPAVFAITNDPYIVFFSNIFAILGLRSLFFLLIQVVEKFHLLKTGVSILLAFIGFKLIFHEWLNHIGFSSVYSLYIIVSVLSASIFLSVIFPKKAELIKSLI